MESKAVCSHADAGCDWWDNLLDLESHVTCCKYKLLQCLYCQKMMIFKDLGEHSEKCMSSMFDNLMKLEEEASRTSYPLPPPEEEIVLCSNADKSCSWQGTEDEMKMHLLSCEMEEYKPTGGKKQRFR